LTETALPADCKASTADMISIVELESIVRQ
jgi:hypothetical protein